jgi:hypothetical protein
LKKRNILQQFTTQSTITRSLIIHSLIHSLTHYSTSSPALNTNIMGDFESPLDPVEVVEEALFNLESILEDDGLIHVLEPDKCLSVLKGLSKGQAVMTLSNLLDDSILLEETLLKIHYIYHLTKSVHDRKINLTSLAIALKDVSTESLKFLTPQDISFIYSTLPPSKIAVGAQAVAKQIDHLKLMKDELALKTTELAEYNEKVQTQVDECVTECDRYKEFILDSVKSRFVSSEYTTSNPEKSLSATINTPSPVPPSVTSDVSNTSARLDSHLNKNKEAPGVVRKKQPEKRYLHALLNKSAEERIVELDFDGAYDSLFAEVSKLEKKFVAQKSNKGEVGLRKRMNELLLRQIELADEKRVLYDRTLANVLNYSRDLQQQASAERLEQGITAVRMADIKFNKDMKTSQELFDYNLIQTEEYFNNQLLDINAKRILEVQKTAAVNSKKLESETRLLVNDKTELEGKRLKYAEVSDELFEKLKEESKVMMQKFTKVYQAAEEIIEENRNVDVDDKRRMKNRKVPLQTELSDLYTDIHSLQHNFEENPILDFEMELNSVCDDHEANAVKFLSKSDEMYKECQEKYMNIVLQRYDSGKTSA